MSEKPRVSSSIRGHLRSNVIGYLALFAALSTGTAYATHPGGADTISTEDIINGQVAGADVADNTVTTNDINNTNGVRSADVRNDLLPNGGLRGEDIAANALSGADVDEATLFNDDSLNSADIASEAVGADELGPLPAARVRPGTNQTISQSTVTEVALGTEDFDVGGLHDNANSARLTAPIDGIYSITASAAISNDPDGNRQLRVALNDSLNATIVSNQVGANPAAGFATDLTASTIVELSAGDFIRMAVHQNGAESLTLFGSRTHLAMAWIAPPAP
jgi:hypothetical protein